MLCKSPYVKSEREAFGCGQCLPCRINKRRVWTNRIILESQLYTQNSFITLTYANEHLPVGGTLVPRETQLFLKRLRKKTTFRFFLVGEYGDQSQRPHYHAALFGYPSCAYHPLDVYARRTCQCTACATVRDAWNLGLTDVGTLTPDSAAYIAGYTTKKMTQADDERLNGRHPEFARMSLRPGIGHDAMWELASLHLQYDIHARLGDVQTVLQRQNKSLPLGRYLTQKVRTYVGREKKAPPITLARMAAQMQDVQARYETLEKEVPGLNLKRFRRLLVRNYLIDKGKGKLQRLEFREQLYKKAKSL